MAGRTLLAGFALLDRQIVDADGRMAGKVDDLELRVPEDGSAPYVTAVLSGRGALASRLGGRVGRLVAWLSARLEPGEHAPGRFSFGVVTSVGNSVDISLRASELDSAGVERRLCESVIGRIPGARRAPE